MEKIRIKEIWMENKKTGLRLDLEKVGSVSISRLETKR